MIKMLKWIGIGLVICGSTAAGISLSRDLEKRVKQLNELRKVVVMLQGEIRYSNAPLSEAFHHVSLRIKEPFAIFLEHVAGHMEEFSGETLSDIFSQHIQEDLKYTSLLPEDLEQLKRLGESMGYLDRQMQLETMNLYLDQVNTACEEAAEHYRNKSKLYHCLGVMGGLFLAVIFI